MKRKPPIAKLLTWLDQYGLLVFAAFLIAFIPLYPKIPLTEAIPGYIVRVRLEDFLILAATLWWFVQLVRQKVTLQPFITKLITAYLIVGFLSTLSAIFITQTVPQSQVHIVKLYLHYFRRIEYFSLFFIVFSAIRTKKHAKILIYTLLLTLIGVTIYGYGQKYLYWPVYSTMNREFSKGVRLYLTEHARVPSTFGGHYDAAAFTMMIITIALSLFLFVKKWWLKALALIAFIAGYWLLILTASRTSFVAYLVAITALFGVSLFVKSWKWALPRWFAVVFISLAIMVSFGDLADRFSQVVGMQRITQYTGQIRDWLQSSKAKEVPENSISIEEAEKQVIAKSDQQPTTEKPEKDLPGDVYEDIPEPKTTIDELGNERVEFVSRTYSDNAYKYGLSAAIRFDALWPRAIDGFLKNPILGSGYSTLTKPSVDVFTEAESTDNDYLRNLGETGLAGFLLFFGTVGSVIAISFKYLKKVTDPLLKAYLLGFIAASIGLLVNATYIDVFEASKVALTFWALSGIALAIPVLYGWQPAARLNFKRPFLKYIHSKNSKKSSSS